MPPAGGACTLWSRDALEVKGPHRRPQKQSDRRLEEVAKAVGVITVGYKCHGSRVPPHFQCISAVESLTQTPRSHTEGGESEGWDGGLKR